MNIISITGLMLTAHHGVGEQERRVGNEFEVNVEIEVPNASEAMKTDNLNDTINYAQIIDIIKNEMNKPSQLIENVAWRIRKALESAFPGKIASGSVSVAKLAPPVHAQLHSVSFVHRW